MTAVIHVHGIFARRGFTFPHNTDLGNQAELLVVRLLEEELDVSILLLLELPSLQSSNYSW
jgi:hypothetical protein